MIKVMLHPTEDTVFHATSFIPNHATIQGVFDHQEVWSTEEDAGFYLLPDNYGLTL